MIKPNVGKAQKEKISGMILFWKLFGRGSGRKGEREREKMGRKKEKKGEMKDLQVHLFQLPRFTNAVTHLFRMGPNPCPQSCQMEETDTEQSH